MAIEQHEFRSSRHISVLLVDRERLNDPQFPNGCEDCCVFFALLYVLAQRTSGENLVEWNRDDLLFEGLFDLAHYQPSPWTRSANDLGMSWIFSLRSNVQK
ncbi:hypothetical protein D3C77_378110 [compost metagenome]